LVAVFPHSFHATTFAASTAVSAYHELTRTVKKISARPITNPLLILSRSYTMKLTKNTIAATFAALLIGGLSISPVSAKVHNENGRVPTATHAGFEINSDSSYVNGRSAPEGTQPILNSSANGKTNGRQG
jgi:hypothetical protein